MTKKRSFEVVVTGSVIIIEIIFSVSGKEFEISKNFLDMEKRS